ncbi:MAG: hypothetical protein SPJ34_04545, partial [Candidatus Ornithospirochaeta sp.]|nr:hypothetical protein [Candidatus Ornithospirochaeta sp.]
GGYYHRLLTSLISPFALPNKAIALVLMLLSCLFSAFPSSADVTWAWSAPEKKAIGYRWRLNGGEWNELPGDIHEVTTTGIESSADNLFEIEYTRNGKSWVGRSGKAFEGNEGIPLIATWGLQNQNELHYRYRVNGGDWSVLEAGLSSIRVSGLVSGVPAILEIETSENGSKWSYPVAHRINPFRENVSIDRDRTLSYRGIASPLTIGIFDFFNGHHIEDARYLTVTDIGFSADNELAWRVAPAVSLYASVGYSYVRKKQTVIPNAFTVHYFKALCGMDIRLFGIGRFSMDAGLSAGMALHFNASSFNASSIAGLRLRADYRISGMLSAGLQSTAYFAYLPSEDPLYKSMTYLIDALSVSFEVRF